MSKIDRAEFLILVLLFCVTWPWTWRGRCG